MTYRDTPARARTAGQADWPEISQGGARVSVRQELPRLLSLFCGAGGLDWGFHEEGFRTGLAIDIAPAAVNTYKANFRRAGVLCADLMALGPAGVIRAFRDAVEPGSHIGVIGGPPCQGFSRANNGSSANDPRNRLPALYLDIIRELQRSYEVEFAVFENVPGIRDAKHAQTYAALLETFTGLGMEITESELCALDYGVPQTRRRVVLAALRSGRGYGPVKLRRRKGPETVREAIRYLAQPAYFRKDLQAADIPVHPNHWTMQPKSPRFNNPAAIRTDGRSFKKLAWDAPSPTVAFGHREIHVHPSGRRRLSIYEAMLLQGFPSDYVLHGNLSEQVEQVSNAVPPMLAKSIAAAVRRALRGD